MTRASPVNGSGLDFSPASALYARQLWGSDAEMTGGIELLTALHSDDALFKVLKSGKKIIVQSAAAEAEKFSLNAKVTDALKTFLKECP